MVSIPGRAIPTSDPVLSRIKDIQAKYSLIKVDDPYNNDQENNMFLLLFV